jgi:hypothetical protein
VGTSSDHSLVRDEAIVIYDAAVVRVFRNEVRPPVPVQLPVKTLRWMQTLGRNDLCLHLSNKSGPYSPVSITYTLYQVSKSGVPLPVGGRKAPVKGNVGEFYASGTAGEMGQPGQWIIRWEVTPDFGAETLVFEQRFDVLDYVARTPQSPTQARKGWA